MYSDAEEPLYIILSRTRAFSIDCNKRPRNPGQPAESAKPVHYIQCAGIKVKFAKIVTNRYTVYVYPENLEMNLGLADRVSTGLPPKN